VNGPRNLVLVVTVVIFAAGFCSASDIYIAQNAAGNANGADCADAYAVTWFNSGANWGSNQGQIGPGITVHLCGIFNAPAGANKYLAFQGGGNSANPITLLFESGAVLTATYWSGPAITANGNSYITINGGTNGTIQATANGTGLANQQDNGIGVYLAGSNNSQVENLSVSNLYVHTCTLPITNCTDEGGQNTYGIMWIGGSNVQIGPNNTVHDMKWCAFYGYKATTNAQIFQNTLYHCDHGVVFGDAAAAQTTGSPTATCGSSNGNMICQNTIYDGGNWDDNGDENHHDGIHTWANNAPTSNYYVMISDNYIYGNWGADMGSLIYIESDEQAIPVVNNVLAPTFSPIAGTGILGVATGSGVGGTGVQILNNTIVGASSSNQQCGIAISTTTNPVLENNIVTNTGTGVFINPNGSVTGTVSNFNDYYNIGTANPFYCPGHPGVPFGQWQSACGFDADGTAGNPLLTATYHLTNSSSAAWQTATNLHSLGITTLDSDKNGVARQTTGPWDIGAYEDSETGAPPAPPTGLTAVVQ